MEIFLSWSGNTSHAVAKALHDWIPCVFQSARPWLSSADILPGDRWSIELSEKLQTTEFGILCLSQESLNSPWMLFEAGALSKSLNHSCVVPYLINLPSTRLSGPLSQFQSVQADESGSASLVSLLGELNPNSIRDPQILETAFTKWWSELDDVLENIRVEHQTKKLRVSDVTVITAREIELLKLLSSGATYQDMANRLGISRETIASHVHRIFTKLGVNSTTEAVSMAVRLDLIE